MREKTSNIRVFSILNVKEFFYVIKLQYFITVLNSILNKIPQQVSFFFSLFGALNESKQLHLV